MDSVLEYVVSENEDGQRIDVFIAEKCADISRSNAVRLVECGAVLVNGKTVKKNYKTAIGEKIILSLPDATPDVNAPEDIPLDIVYEDTDVIVINKPRGMVVHPGAGNMTGTLVNALLAHCPDTLSGIGGVARPGIVHRIDKNTSGLLIVAKNDDAHRCLSEQLSTRTLSRVYDAVVFGNIKDEKGEINAPIGRSPKNRQKMAVIAGGREAVTFFEVVERARGYTHVKCKLQTGRTHQIRVHMAYIGHPVASDDVYGTPADKSRLGGQCLHASTLSFVHPRTGEQITLNAPLPEYFKNFLQKIQEKF